MKEATGELGMTVITVVAIAAIAGLFYAFIWPMIEQSIVNRTCSTYGLDYKAETDGKGNWDCCPNGVTFGGEGCEMARSNNNQANTPTP